MALKLNQFIGITSSSILIIGLSFTAANAQDPWGFTYGSAVADTACSMIEGGVKIRKVNRILDKMEEDLIARGTSSFDLEDMGEGFDYWAFRADCPLKDRNK